MLAADNEELRQRRRESLRLVHPLHPAIGNRGQRRVEMLAQFGDERRQWVGEVLILAATEVVPPHHDTAAECFAVGVQTNQFFAFSG